MGRKTSKSAVFLGLLLSIGVLIIAFFLYHMVTRPPERPVPHIEEQVIVLPVEEVRVEPSPIAAEEPAVFEPETAVVPPVVFTEELPPEPISVAIEEDVGAKPPAVIEKEPVSVLIVEEALIPEEEP
ncbi:MAG TPA: hypothetical protein PKZ87_06135, partial [Sphaerochaeta sp.]|nr:hypothetical protein [Sphaerochaeta sp.]